MSAVQVEEVAGVTRTPGVCGGEACVRGTRIMVWLLVLSRRRGESDANLLSGYPTLTPAGLDAAWDYYRHHPLEIEQEVWLNTLPLDHVPGTPVPAGDIIQGRLLGLSNERIISAYDPPLTQADLDAAWEAYRRDPRPIDEYIARSRATA